MTGPETQRGKLELPDALKETREVDRATGIKESRHGKVDPHTPDWPKQHTKPSYYPEMWGLTLPLPYYGGDKLAFVAAALPKEDPDYDLVEFITQCIRAHRKQKEAEKADIEDTKEKAIEWVKLQGDEALKRAGKDRTKMYKDVLAEYHSAVLNNAGWHWNFLASIMRGYLATNRRPVATEDVRTSGENGVVFIRTVAGKLLYTVHFGRSRFDGQPDTASKVPKDGAVREVVNVYTKKGYRLFDRIIPDPDQQPHEAQQRRSKRRLEKQFVLDNNGVFTHRYVKRATLIFQIANMFGLEVIPPTAPPRSLTSDYKEESSEKWLGGLLLPATVERVMPAPTAGEDDLPTVRPVYDKDGKELAGQRPRQLDSSFGGHADTFDIRRAASIEINGFINPDFTPYRSRGTRGYGIGTKTRYPMVTGWCEERQRTDQMGINEKASMQVRNGSGPNQPFLSAGAHQADYKHIRGNKGERFDEGGDFQAVVRCDLGIAKELGVEIVNVHAPESDRFKIAYDRYYDRNDIYSLERQLAKSLLSRFFRRNSSNSGLEPIQANLVPYQNDANVQQAIGDVVAKKRGSVERLAAALADLEVWPWDIDPVSLRRDKFGGLSLDATKKIMRLRGHEIDVRKEKIKRSAESELDEYIASARKNREVLMSSIPLACVTEIRLATDFVHTDQKGTTRIEKWPGLDPNVQKGKWLPFDDRLKRTLRDYLHTTDGLGRYTNIDLMWKNVVRQKALETGDRT